MPAIFDQLPGLFAGLLGDPVAFTPPGAGAPVTINAIIEWESLVATPFEGAGTNVARVVAYARGADVGQAPGGGTIATPASAWFPAATWKIVEPISPDGQGMTLLTLEKVG